MGLNHKKFYAVSGPCLAGLLALIIICSPLPVHGQSTGVPAGPDDVNQIKEKRIEKDRNDDSETDQIFFFDENGKIVRIETDSDYDGRFNAFHYYVDAQLDRIETDADADGIIDRIDFLKNGQRVRQVKMDQNGRIVQEALFDADQNLSLLKKDTTGDFQFDTIYRYQSGQLQCLTRDTNANSTVNVWQDFTDNLPVEQRTDDNEDGIMDKIIVYDKEGRPEKISNTPCEGQRFGVFSYYLKGEIIRLERDSNCDGKTDDQTLFKNGLPATQEKDTNYDGRPDIYLSYDDKGQMSEIREDSDFNGRIDRIRYFRDTVLIKSESDTDHDGYFETLSTYKKGKLRTQTIDRNKDRQFEITIFFNAEEKKEKVEIDTDSNQTPDLFQYFENNLLVRVEKDENQDGTIDAKIFYVNTVQDRMVKDENFDGYFETTHRYNDKEWPLVVEQDFDRDGAVDLRCFFSGTVMRIKEIDEDSDGTVDIREFYTQGGRLEKSMEKEGGASFLNITWFYDEQEKPLSAVHDRNQDQQPDTWYYYRNGVLQSVEEDTNNDSKPDLWETYDSTETLVQRKKDLDYDGTPDIVDQI